MSRSEDVETVMKSFQSMDGKEVTLTKLTSEDEQKYYNSKRSDTSGGSGGSGGSGISAPVRK
jgi:hypothetical protein